MQKLEGDGMAFVHAGGTIHKKVLNVGETLRVDTGCLVAMTGDVDYNIELLAASKLHYSVEKDYSLRHSVDQEQYGCNHYHSPG